MRKLPDMEITHESMERAGSMEMGEGQHSAGELVAELDSISVPDLLAHERDCLSFMMGGWPDYARVKGPDQCFRIADLLSQIEDVRSRDAHGTLAMILDRIEQHVRATEPTVQ